MTFKIFFQVNKQCSFQKKYGKCKKKQGHSAYKKRSKIELLSIRTKLSYSKFFFGKCISHRNEKIQIFLYKPVYLGLSILELSKIVLFEFWYDYVKLKYGEKAKFYDMDTDSFIVYIKAEDIYAEISKILKQDLILQIMSQTDHYLKGKNKKVIGLIKDELGEKTMKDFAALSSKTYSHLTDNNNEDKKAKCIKKCVIKNH